MGEFSPTTYAEVSFIAKVVWVNFNKVHQCTLKLIPSEVLSNLHTRMKRKLVIHMVYARISPVEEQQCVQLLYVVTVPTCVAPGFCIAPLCLACDGKNVEYR